MTHVVNQARLYLVADAVPETATRVEVALGAVEFETLLIVPVAGRELDAQSVKPIIELAQGRGVAALLLGNAQLARVLKADGVHLPWSKDVVARYAEAREILGTRFIVGADAGRSRHDAMQLGEMSADYIAFGIPPHVEDRETAAERRLELCQWWSEIFQVPCVAFDVETAQDARALAETGVDFVAVHLPPAMPPAELQDWLRAFAAELPANGTVA